MEEKSEQSIHEKINMLLETENYYEMLDVPHTTSSDGIRQAYLSKAKLWHPDKNIDNKDIDKLKVIFQKISDAYATLSDTTNGINIIGRWAVKIH